MRRKGEKGRGRLLFFLPFLVLAVLAISLYVSSGLNQTGTLAVEAEADGSSINAGFTLGGNAYVAPMNFTLAQGPYTVVFSDIQWFHTPAQHTVQVLDGKLATVLGQYTPVSLGISIQEGSFNATAVSALHGVTPVTWTNNEGAAQTLLGGPFGQISIQPGRSYTYTFQTVGSYTLFLQGTNNRVTVQVV